MGMFAQNCPSVHSTTTTCGPNSAKEFSINQEVESGWRDLPWTTTRFCIRIIESCKGYLSVMFWSCPPKKRGFLHQRFQYPTVAAMLGFTLIGFMPLGRNFISISQISALYGEVMWKGRSKRTSYFSKTQRRILFLTLYISGGACYVYTHTHTHPFNGLIPLTFRLKVEERSQAYKLLCQCGRQRTRKRCGGGPMFVDVVDVSRGEMQLLDLTR